MKHSYPHKWPPIPQVPSQRRSERQNDKQSEQTTVWLNLHTQELWRNGVAIYLRSKTFSVLQYLISRPGQLISHAELQSVIWPDTVVGKGVLKNCLWEIRRALADSPRHPHFLETVPRRGYRMLVPLATIPTNRKSLIGSSQKDADSRQQIARLDSLLTMRDQQSATFLTGRTEELTQLHHWWAKALQGRRQIVFLKGEAGIGKTTLVREFLRRVGKDDTVRIIYGQCSMHYGEQEPYLTLLDAFCRLNQSLEPTLFLDAFRRHAPSWLAQMPALLDTTERQWLQRELRCATPQRMLREGSDVLETLSKTVPLIVVLEDLHWSEHTTLNLMSFIAQRQEPARFMILGTYRPEESADTGHFLQKITRELCLHQQCQALSLKPLTKTHIRQYLDLRFAAEHAAGSLVPQTFVEWMYYWTEGHPLFLINFVTDWFPPKELFRETLPQPLPQILVKLGLPETIVQFFETQFDRLTVTEQRLLQTASLEGTEFTAAAVGGSLQQTIKEIEELCNDLSYRRLFIHRVGVDKEFGGKPAACYAFRHKLAQAFCCQHPFGEVSRRSEWTIKH